jgi:hypothetical protein
MEELKHNVQNITGNPEMMTYHLEDLDLDGRVLLK